MNRQRLINAIAIVQWRLRDKCRRYGEALAYARDRITAAQADDNHLQLPGRGRLVSCYWHNHRQLQSLVQSACERVASKWSSDGFATDAAEIGRSTWSATSPRRAASC
jgi:hypothetical protein